MTKIIPVVLITGFLGAGKTTFINHVIKQNPDKKISLILNEFGDIKLESQFIEQKGIGMISELSGGCLCCVARVDLPRVIRYTLEKASKTEYLIIEASGLSDPDPVRATLTSADLAELIKLDTVVAVVDAINFVKNSQEHPLVMSQIAEADLAVVSKSQGLTQDAVDNLIMRVSHIGTGTRTLIWDEKLDTSIIFDPPLIPKNVTEHHHEHVEYEEFWYQAEKVHNLEHFTDILNSLPENILRVKGYTDDGTARYLLQKVGNHVDIREGVSMGKKETVILIIGSKLDKSSLKALLSSTAISV